MVYEQYLAEYSRRWQTRIINTSFISAAVITVFEIAYYFILTATKLRDQTSLEYIVRFILLPASIIFVACFAGGYIVYKSRLKSENKSLAALLVMVVICGTAASVHNIFAATLCSFFVPLATSIVFGRRRITNTVGVCCIIGELISMAFASQDLRGDSAYFLLDCLMFFIVFGILWYSTLLLMKNEQEKRHVIDHMQQEQSMLQQKICRDELTGLYNLLGLQLYADGKTAENNPDLQISSLAFLDVDDFKAVNDTFGHEVGNQVLIRVSDCIRQQFPADSCVARYGGDEFVILVPGVSPDECKHLLDCLLKNVADSLIPELEGGTLSISSGVSLYNFCTPVLEAINTSDQAMYEAKAAGKNRTIVAWHPCNSKGNRLRKQ